MCIRDSSNLHKHLSHTVTGIEIIVYYQCLQTFQFCDFLYTVILRLDPQWQADNKFSTFAPVSYTHLDVYKRQAYVRPVPVQDYPAIHV